MTYLIKQLDLLLRSQIEPIALQFDITASQYSALTAIHRSPGISSAQLARESFVTAQATNDVVNTLEGKQLIERYQDSSNRRVRHIRLTPRGLATLTKCNAQVDRVEERLLSKLGHIKPDSLRKSLQLCLDGLS